MRTDLRGSLGRRTKHPSLVSVFGNVAVGMFYWVAVQELILSYYVGGTLLTTIYTQ